MREFFPIFSLYFGSVYHLILCILRLRREVQLFCWLVLSADIKKPNYRLISKQLTYISTGYNREKGALSL